MKKSSLQSMVLMLIALFGIAASVTADDAANKLVALLERTASYQAAFEQRIISSKHSSDEITKGAMFSKKPNLFRWEIKEPFENLIISNGKKLFNYDKDLEQVTIQSFKAENFSSTPFFLSGDAKKLQQEYDILIAACQASKLKNSTTCFKLTPKDPQLAFQYLLFGFDKQEVLKELVLFDQLGQTTVIKFLNPILNREISDSLFKINIPSGVDIIESE